MYGATIGVDKQANDDVLGVLILLMQMLKSKTII